MELGEAHPDARLQAALQVAPTIDSEAVTVDGVLLSTLGKGLPITDSAKPCEICRGLGYKSYNAARGCPTCEDTGLLRYTCKHCDGRGCKRCRDSGYFYPADTHNSSDIKNPNWEGFGVLCRECKGESFRKKGKKDHQICRECKGVGEVLIWNPVLPMGFLQKENNK